MKQKKSIKGKKRPVRDKAGHFVRAKRKYRRRHKAAEGKAGIQPDIQTSLKRLVEGIKAMKESQKKALLAISAAALALGAAATALAESAGETDAPADPAPADNAKEKKAAEAAAKKKAAEEATKKKAEEEAAKKGEEAGSDDLFKQAIEAAKEYASVYGREGVVKVMAKFLPAGAKTMQDIPADKLPAFIAELKG